VAKSARKKTAGRRGGVRARRGAAAKSTDVLRTARRVIRIEAEEVARLETRLGEEFVEAVRLIVACIGQGGKVVLTGIGKSGLVAKKVASTMTSTGTTAFFMHPVEAAHGDLGMLGPRDVVIAISKSGLSEELAALIPTFRRLGIRIIAVTGDSDSALARDSDLVLDSSVRQEACPFGLAPTASATCALALGDALAIAVFTERGLKPEDFAFHHPGGALGKRLLLMVKDIMHAGDAVPLVREDTTLRDALLEMIGKRLGVTGVVDSDGRLTGIITDGDIKRILMGHPDVGDIREVLVGSVMTPHPRTIDGDALVTRAIQRMEEDPRKLITCLVIVDQDGRPTGLVHMHDCLRAGIA
jgi:arabinose-5-phosphate isomerase